jgi:hypothetical protein
MEDRQEDDSSSSTEDPADQMLNRGAFLRQLREMERQDEAERAASIEADEQQHGGEMVQLSTGDMVLRYESFLRHQLYYDDLKHVDMKYIDFGLFDGTGDFPLVVEQDKTLGKGGLCWDAAFILGEHVISILKKDNCDSLPSKTIELGCGTGLCGLMIATVLPLNVTLTDLPELMPRLGRNVNRNFPTGDANFPSDVVMEECIRLRPRSDTGTAAARRGSAVPSVLCWGNKDQEAQHGPHDIILGADVVATLYDPVALAETIHHLSHKSTKVYISFKERLSSIHRQFEAAMHDRFERIDILPPVGSRNHNPAVQILVAESKKETTAP